MVKNFMLDRGIDWFTSQDPVTKASIVERLNETIKSKMFKKFHTMPDRRWHDGVLQDCIEAYNNEVHSSINIEPAILQRGDPEDVQKAWHHLYGGDYSRLDKGVNQEFIEPRAPQFQPGDFVRLVKERQPFDKYYLPNYTHEVFVVIDVINSTPGVYVVSDLQDETIQGTFHGNELQKVGKPEHYAVEKILKERGPEKFVKWVGYPEKFNEWVHESQIGDRFRRSK
jgi:hypothetical protein